MAQLNCPEGVFVSNGEIFIADTYNHRVRKVLRNGQIVTIAGNGIKGYDGDGQLATNAQLDNPTQVVVSSSDQVYILDGNRIRKIDRNGIISTIAGTGEEEYNGDDQLAIHANMGPYGLFVTEDEEVLIADDDNHRVRKIDRNGIISTIAGNGNEYHHVDAEFNGDGQLATTAQLSHPLSVFQYKHEIYVSENGSSRIRKIDRNGIISTIVGPDTVEDPAALFVHNDELYFTHDDDELCKLQRNGTIKTIIAGCELFTEDDDDDDEINEIYEYTMSALDCPEGIFVDQDSQIYLADTNNQCIRKIDQDGTMITIVGILGENGYSGDVPFDFQKYPHIGPKKKSQLIKPFPKAYHDLIVICETSID